MVARPGDGTALAHRGRPAALGCDTRSGKNGGGRGRAGAVDGAGVSELVPGSVDDGAWEEVVGCVWRVRGRDGRARRGAGRA